MNNRELLLYNQQPRGKSDVVKVSAVMSLHPTIPAPSTQAASVVTYAQPAPPSVHNPLVRSAYTPFCAPSLRPRRSSLPATATTFSSNNRSSSDNNTSPKKEDAKDAALLTLSTPDSASATASPSNFARSFRWGVSCEPKTKVKRTKRSDNRGRRSKREKDVWWFRGVFLLIMWRSVTF